RHVAALGPAPPEQVGAGDEAQEHGQQQHHRAGVLVGGEPVDQADDAEEEGRAQEDQGLDPVTLVGLGRCGSAHLWLPWLPWGWTSSMSAWFMSHTGRSERMGGMRSKLWWGGGEV